MIQEINIKNYKSILDMNLSLGSFNVMIGANGCGKTNILEAIAMASAASTNMLRREFLDNRGIRVCDSKMMFSAFDNGNNSDMINITIENDRQKHIKFFVTKSKTTSREWDVATTENTSLEMTKQDLESQESITQYFKQCDELRNNLISEFNQFVIFALEESKLRYSDNSNSIYPLGRKGEGLFSYLKELAQKEEGKLIFEEIKENLFVFDWFDDMEVPKNQLSMDSQIYLKDQYLKETLNTFDQRSSNEGFLYLLFYFTLIISDQTPKFFAIENIETGFNPKLCREIVGRMISLAKKHGKQIIVTTHNPAILDGLNLNDNDQRLLVVSRSDDGYTRVKRLSKKNQDSNIPSMKLSDLWISGYLGGVPNNF